MKIIVCRGADQRAVNEAAEALRDGDIIIYPTDSVYALGCNALNARAVERLCKLKGINPDKNLLSIVCSDISQAAEYVRIDNRAFAVLKRNLPGALTFILPAATKLPKVFRGRKSIGLRIPDNEFARALAESLGNPIMTSSLSTEDDYAEFNIELAAEKYNGQVALAIDNGTEAKGLSTIVDLTDSNAPELVRRGIVDFDI